MCPDPEVLVRKRFAVLISIGMLFVVTSAPPVSSAVVIKGVACSTCSSGYKWKLRAVSVATGTKVTWRSVVGLHNVTSTSSNWSKSTTISAGQTTSFTFKKAGTYRFRCTLHSTLTSGKCSGMCGKVVVG